MRQQLNSLFTEVRAYKKNKPGFLFIFMLLSSVSMATVKQQQGFTDTIPPQSFTVAAIIAPPGNTEYYEVTFFQSARFYKLIRKNKNCSRSLQLLKQSKKNNHPVQVFLTERNGDIIYEVRKI